MKYKKEISDLDFINIYLDQIQELTDLFFLEEYHFLDNILEEIKKVLDNNFRKEFKRIFNFDIGEVDTSTFMFDREKFIECYKEQINN